MSGAHTIAVFGRPGLVFDGVKANIEGEGYASLAFHELEHNVSGRPVDLWVGVLVSSEWRGWLKAAFPDTEVPGVAVAERFSEVENLGLAALGCRSIISADASSDQIRAAIRLTLAGYHVQPFGFALKDENKSSDVTNEEVAMLKYLRDHRTVAAIACEMGYSERTVYRMLGRIYAKLGAPNRHGALAEAVNRSLI